MRRYLCIALLLAVALTASAQDVVGRITYLEGTPQIVRDGSVVYDTVDFGFPVENFDAVQTDEESSLQIEINPSTGIDFIASSR